MVQGLFITLEGPDGGGKTTQQEMTAAWLKGLGRDVVCSREPGGTGSAERIRDLVLDPQLPLTPRAELLLYLAARAEHVAKKLRPALEAGQVVICDRFSDSTLVYQGLVRGLPLGEVARLEHFAAAGLEPEVTLVLDADPEQLLVRRQQRGVKDRFENEGLAFQKKVRAGFLTLARQYPERMFVLDALQPPAAVQEQVRQILQKFLRPEQFKTGDDDHV